MAGITNSEDIALWPDGDWCYRENLDEMTHKSDDYEMVEYGSSRWRRIAE